MMTTEQIEFVRAFASRTIAGDLLPKYTNPLGAESYPYTVIQLCNEVEMLQAQLAAANERADSLQKTLDDMEMRAIRAENRVCELEADNDCIWHNRYNAANERAEKAEADRLETIRELARYQTMVSRIRAAIKIAEEGKHDD